MSYHHNSTAFVWWDGTSKWIISDEVGVITPPIWERDDPNIAGDYTPVSPATGTATVK